MKSVVVGALLALAATVAADEAQQPLIPDDYNCDDHKYEISVYSMDPLVIYIENFVSPFEREHLQRITNGTFARSNVASADGDVVSSHRTSSSTTVGSDPVTSCISRRAARFQGLKPISHLEPIQLVHYSVGEQYHFHTDWFPDDATIETGHAGVPRGGNRVSSFFAYIDASDDIAGGGTHFPKLPAQSGEGWCRFIECDDQWDSGVTFRAVAGNAVYWTNLVTGPDGKPKGDDRVLHAGLPVIRGSKLGMNIWSKEGDFA
ncbi:oxidoreductase [Plectosphaerella cucumerina]|uniref:Oxidoreductase n=1 Tax=Plectosphaerella cucumerina TaxID=40658 RepID=A0A8K0WZ80_9PEZI|nr:oxidoreductase [Plectosphaerella cucumerina]